MTSISEKRQQVLDQIHHAISQAQRPANSVTLLAVSKAQQINHIQQAFEAGQQAFGESYISEAVDKITALAALPICWHFIGPIQSNKTRAIAEHFEWVQSVDRIKIARRLDQQRPTDKPPLNICVQVDPFNETAKQGCSLEHLDALMDEIDTCEHLVLRGIMAIPPKQTDPDAQRAQFDTIQSIYRQAAKRFDTIDTLSMGMSGDMTAAVAAGSTMVRVGTALFGPRPDNWKQRIK